MTRWLAMAQEIQRSDKSTRTHSATRSRCHAPSNQASQGARSTGSFGLWRSRHPASCKQAQIYEFNDTWSHSPKTPLVTRIKTSPIPHQNPAYSQSPQPRILRTADKSSALRARGALCMQMRGRHDTGEGLPERPITGTRVREVRDNMFAFLVWPKCQVKNPPQKVRTFEKLRKLPVSMLSVAAPMLL
jgi:hypothetical protein